jgi:hypothetical protein
MIQDFETATLEKLQFGIQKEVSRQILDPTNQTRIKAYISDISNNIVVQVRTFVWAEKLDPVVITHEKTWWDAFKKRWFPQWLLKRYPVEYKTHTIQFYATYPNYKPFVEGETCVVQRVKSFK